MTRPMPQSLRPLNVPIKAVTAAIMTATVLLTGCSDGIQSTTASSPASQDSAGATPGAQESNVPAANLTITELKPGTGPAIQAGQTAVVHYTGWLYAEDAPDHKGKKFDSSVDRNDPFSFPVGGGQVIQGWDQGVAGMQVGQQRRLTIPAELGYGARGAGGVIPPGATLVFDVELLGIK
jgi:FKBP-type peptidyl-prolyl cis-trans isomerase